MPVEFWTPDNGLLLYWAVSLLLVEELDERRWFEDKLEERLGAYLFAPFVPVVLLAFVCLTGIGLSALGRGPEQQVEDIWTGKV